LVGQTSFINYLLALTHPGYGFAINAWLKLRETDLDLYEKLKKASFVLMAGIFTDTCNRFL
jgi:hypothetical protein